MATVVIRVWLPDRPGALGTVASIIGHAGGEIVGIDILERGAGRAIDEFAVDLAAHASIDHLVDRLRAVDGIDVEEVRPVSGGAHDPRADVLEIASIIVGAPDREGVLEALAVHGGHLLGGEWSAVVSSAAAEVLAHAGSAPEPAWLVAFVGGTPAASVPESETGPDDVVWAPLARTGLSFVVGRDGTGFRARERRQVAGLARIADGRLARHGSVGCPVPHD